VEIREWAPVSEILVENGKVRGVKLQDGSEEYADRVLVTLEPGLQRCLRRLV